MSTETRTATVPVPQGVSVKTVDRTLTVVGPLGTVSRPFPSDVVGLQVDGATVTLELRLDPRRKQSKSLLNTWAAHVKNLVGGVSVGVEAQMKVVAAHFPM